jgi:ornithine cyclodeaminase/alanine dehydrogenase-like protein (mu-crystallin family)
LNEDEVTLFKSVGTGVQDLMVAAHLLELADQLGVGAVTDEVNSVKPAL